MWLTVTWSITTFLLIYTQRTFLLQKLVSTCSESCLNCYCLHLFLMKEGVHTTYLNQLVYQIRIFVIKIAFTSANRNPRLIVTLFLPACLFTRSHIIWFGTNLIPDSLLDATLPGTCVSSQYWTSDPSCLTQTLWSYWTLLISPHH